MPKNLASSIRAASKCALESVKEREIKKDVGGEALVQRICLGMRAQDPGLFDQFVCKGMRVHVRVRNLLGTQCSNFWLPKISTHLAFPALPACQVWWTSTSRSPMRRCMTAILVSPVLYYASLKAD